jgi:hypothetical protein
VAMENDGGTQGRRRACEPRFLALRLRTDADEVGGHPRADDVAWPAGPACTPAGAWPRSGAASA